MRQIPLSTVLARGLRLRCPRCGEGKMFRHVLSMHERCDVCELKYERAPGYFLGSAYINYAVTAIILVPAWCILHFVFEFTKGQLLPFFIPFTILFPILFFPWARSLWLAADCYLDATGIQEDR